MATYAEPHSYDLCETHAHGLTAPRGWEVVRLDIEAGNPVPGVDDLAALADAVREAGRPSVRPPADLEADSEEIGRRGHLRMLRAPTTG